MSDLFQHQGTTWSGISGQLDSVRDLTLVSGSNGLAAQVVTGPHPGLQLSNWGVTGSISARDDAALVGAGAAGIDPHLVTGQTAAGRDFTLLLGAGNGGLSGLWSDGQGGFGTVMPLGLSGAPQPGDLTAALSVIHNGEALLYGLRPGTQAPILWQMDDAGVLRQRSPGSHAPEHDGIAAPGLTDLAMAGDYLVAAGTGAALMRLYRVGNEGTLQAWQTLGAADNPGISGPVALESATIHGRDFVIAAASGSATLSVWEVTTNGRLELRDHVLDSLDSRFAGVTHLEVVTRGDTVYIAAAGGDQGVSLFALSPTGTLVHLGVQADDLAWSMDGIAGLDLGLTGSNDLALVTSGLRDAGVSVFTLDPGAPGLVTQASAVGATVTGTQGGDLLEGAGGRDRLIGGVGADILIDGAGRDTLQGGLGPDTFVFVTDGEAETVSDFDVAQDRLDLSGWAFLRSAEQLQINSTVNGAEIVYDGPAGQEILRLISVTGDTLDADAVLATLAGTPDRFLPAWLDAESLRREDGPDPQARIVTGGTGNDTLTGGDAGDTVTGAAGSDRMDGGMGGDSLNGGIGFDTLLGGGGDDILRGLDGWDDLQGGTGDDTLYGNNGNDLGAGGAGADSLFGGVGGDTLFGGDGHDHLRGDPGADLLMGDAGDDLLRGNAGADLIQGGMGADTLEGGINHDTLEGGFGDDLLMAGNGTDSLHGGAGHDTLFGNAGNDRLEGGGGWDILNGGIGADTFVFAGGGTAIIEDFQNNIDTLALDRVLWGGGNRTSSQILSEFGRIDGGNLILDFGGMGEVVLEGMGVLVALSDDIALI